MFTTLQKLNLSRIATAFAVALPLMAGSAFAEKAEKKETKPKVDKAAKVKDEKIAFDPAASVVKWEGKKVTGQHDGTIGVKKGDITLAGKELKAGEVELDMNSIVDVDLKDPEYNKKLITHLKSEDFFDVAKFPTALLKIKSSKSVEGLVGPTYEVTADLTIKGKTNEIKFPAVIQTKDGKTTATANITIDRTKWDIKYGSGKFFKGLGDKVINDDFKIDVALASK